MTVRSPSFDIANANSSSLRRHRYTSPSSAGTLVSGPLRTRQLSIPRPIFYNMKLAVVLCLMLAASCAYAGEPGDAAATATFGGRKAVTAWDIINNDPNLSILAGLIRNNNLTAALDNKRRPVTVLAPSNAALTALTNTLPAGTPMAGPFLTNILLQHVTRAKLTVKTPVGTSAASLNTGNLITRVNVGVNLMDGRSKSRATSWSGGQRNVVNSTRTITALKGTVFVVNGVLLPNNAFPSVQAITAFYTDFSLATELVIQSGFLDDANNPASQKTLFPSSNAALTTPEAQALIASLTPDQYVDILNYAVSPVIVTTPFTNTAAVPTLLAGQTLGLVTPTTVVAANSRATVVLQNIFFPGGVLQGLGGFLIPTFA